MSEQITPGELVARANQAVAMANEERQAYLFMRRHLHDFKACDANASALSEYLKANNLPWDQDSLEQAFDALRHQLAPVIQDSSVVEAEKIVAQQRQAEVDAATELSERKELAAMIALPTAELRRRLTEQRTAEERKFGSDFSRRMTKLTKKYGQFPLRGIEGVE
jgi:hypothetical protein